MNSEKVKEIRIALCKKCDLSYMVNGQLKVVTSEDILTLINELESENERVLESCKNCHYIKDLEIANGHAKELKDRIAELEEGIAKSMLGCEFLPECTKEIAEKIWNMAKITVDATKHIIVQDREYLHLDALKEIIKSCGVEIKE